MKFLLTSISLFILFIAPSTAQTKITKRDLLEINKISEHGKQEKAIKKINTLFATNPVKDTNYIYLLILRAEFYERSYQYEEAIQDLETLLQYTPEQAIDFQRHIGMMKKNMGDFDGAIKAYQKIYAADSSNSGYFYFMSSVYINMSRYQDAVEILNRGANTQLIPAENYHYAVAYFNLNQVDSAKKHIESYFALLDGKADFSDYVIEAKINDALGNRQKACESITKANEIIKHTKIEKLIRKKSTRFKNYFFVKKRLSEIEEAKNLKNIYCK